MKRNLLPQLRFFSHFTRLIYTDKILKLNAIFKLRYSFILILLFFYSASKAQTLAHPFPATGSLVLPAGIDQVTVEGWGAGGAGGAAVATLTVGRSGGGGGGGAYARGIIATSTPQTLAINVGTATAGGSSNGASGGASFVTGYNASFYAPGGSGGTANTGGTPSGGNGGSGAVGSQATEAGANGTAGSSALLGAIFWSGAGGAGGNTIGGGGAGGAAISSLVLGNSAGNSGSNYGGGGGGGISSLLSTQNGGGGARGHMILTYTCKTYSLTGTSAANVCTATGTTSLVQLTGSTTSLPKGTYTVTYSRSSPSATGLTATMTVGTAGTGQFTATGLNVIGNSTITVTSLASMDCTSTISSNNATTILVGAQPSITLGTTTAVCTNGVAQNTTLTYSATTNSPNTYSITWNASPANSFATVTNATLSAGSINIAIPANTQPGTYTGSLTVRNVAGCTSAANNFTITVNPLPTITLGTAGAVCFNTLSQVTNLSYSATTNSPTTYSIVWNSSPTNTFAPVINTSLPANSIPITVPAGTSPGTYTGTITVRNANGCSSTGSNFTITVNPLPTITLGSVGIVCFNTSAQTANLSYSATTNLPTTYSITWSGSPTNSFATVTDASLPANSIGIAVPAGTSPGTYTGTLTVKNVTSCVSAANNFTVTVSNNPTIVTTGTLTAVCQKASAQLASLTYTATTNSPISYSIDWATLTDQGTTAFAFAAGGGTINTINVPANTAPGTYTGLMTILTSNGCSATQSVSLTVNAVPTITTSGTLTAVCQSASVQSSSLTYNVTTNSPISYSIDWATLTDQGTTAFAFAAGGGSINTINVPANTAPGTYTGTMTILTSNGCSATQSVSLTVNAVPTITTSGVLTAVCQRASAQLASLTYTATTNSPISYSIDWATLADQGTTAFAFAAGGGSINTINVPANTASGTYTGVMTILTSNGCSATQPVSLTVNGSPTISTSGIFVAVCQSGSAQTTTLNYNSTTGSPINYAIDWVALTDQGTTPFPFSSGSGTVINVNVPANTAAGTYNGVMTISTANGCPVNQGVSLTVNAVSAPTASATQQPSCENNTGIITVTSPAPGTGYSYSINGVDYSNTSGIFTGLAPGPYNVKVKNNTSGCESPSTPITINVLITKTWNGSVNANWTNASNWTPSGVPLASDCVNIPALATSPIISGTNGSFFANRLTIENNGSLVVQSSNTITVTNEVNVVGNGVFIFENNSSLVQVSNAVNTGNITYRRNTSPIRRYDLTYWSSPVTRVPAFTLYNLSPNTLGDKFYKYVIGPRWVIIYNGTEEMVKGTGYSIRAPQNYDIDTPQVYQAEFIGVPNNGLVLGPEAVPEKFNLIGNPYPSAIYADQFIYDNAANFYGTLYFWTHNTLPTQSVPGDNNFHYGDNDYAIYNLSGNVTVGGMTGIGAPTPGNQDPPLGYIAAGQSFFAKSITDQKAVFTNSMRVPNRNSQFYKSVATTEIEKYRVWLNLTNTQGAFKQLLIGYITGATNLWDNNYDAVSMDANPYIDFYSINENKKLVIQGRAIPFVASDTIPLGYRSALEGEFTIAIDHTDGNLDNQVIYLQDNVTKTIHNLKTGGYKFTTTIGVFPDRFVLRYTNPNDAVLGNENFENLNGNISVSVREKNIKLQSFSDKENIQEAAVYDVGGKLLYYKNEIDDKEWLITNLHSGPQVLLVKITLDNGKTVTKKIVYN
ncbi:T9SS sorting signal type C domain-containing protein [Flavobacterium sp. GSB-24]|uniref:T9SS sorting signal type C domain-containing protein n=1 Tax=Flavobacterium sp. GSB-24 TaxID=2994319 RepID=UPI0024924B53|nr:T9SS sorting signal type C domain-containing protein [Flavobacterium sp. GSB-24]